MPVLSFLKKFFKCSRKLIFLLFFSIFFVIIFYLAGIFFRVSTIEVFGKKINYTLRGINQYQAVNLLFVNTKEIEQKLYGQNPQIKNIIAEKKFPSTLIIIIEFQKPLAALRASNGFFYIGQDGRIIFKKKEKKDDLTVVNFYQKIDYSSVSLGESLDYKEIITALKYLSKSNKLGLKTNTIDINGSYMIRLKLDNKEILFSSEKSIESQLDEFETVIKSFKIRGQDYKRLDFRFEKPIITF